MKLKDILSITDSFEFLNALTDLAIPPGTSFDPPLEKRHELRQMISTLNGMYIYVGNDGIWKILIEEGAAYWFARAQVWLEQIKATRTREYLEATALAFPSGRIPADDSERAELVLESYEVYTRLNELDKIYKGTMDEIADCLRLHIRIHFEQFRSELEDRKNIAA